MPLLKQKYSQHVQRVQRQCTQFGFTDCGADVGFFCSACAESFSVGFWLKTKLWGELRQSRERHLTIFYHLVVFDAVLTLHIRPCYLWPFASNAFSRYCSALYKSACSISYMANHLHFTWIKLANNSTVYLYLVKI